MKKLLFFVFAICAALPQGAVCTGGNVDASINPDIDADIEAASENNESENNNSDVKSTESFIKSPFATTSQWGDANINTNPSSSYWDTVTKNYQTKQINDVKATYDESQNKSNTPTTNNSTETKGTTENPPKAQHKNSAPMTPDPEKVQQAKDAEQAYQDARDIEKAGRPLTALATGMTGTGGYMIASSISEKIADKNAEEDMKAYLANMYCDYGGGQQVDLGDTEIIPDGGELFNYYQEYVNTANRLKSTKAALNLTPGIESQVVYTDAKYNLYNYQPAGARSTGEISLARALMDANSADATAWAEQKEKTNTLLGVGTTLAVGGIGTGLANRAYTNKYREQHQRLKEETERTVQQIVQTDAAQMVQAQIVEQPTQPSNPVMPNTDANTQKPITANQFAIELATISVSPDQGFDFNGVKLTDYLTGFLDSFAHQLTNLLSKTEFESAKIKITITAHTDHVPLRNNNAYSNLVAFSKARAETVENYLLDKLSNLNGRIDFDAQGKGAQNCTTGSEQSPQDAPECRKIEIKLEDTTNWDSV